MAHHIFRARTVMVGKSGAEAAFRALTRVMNEEGMRRDISLRVRYEKPTVKRRRLKYESAQRIYNREMQRKIAFLVKGQREETPWS